MKILLLLTLMTSLFADINLLTDRSDFHIKWMVKDFKEQTDIDINVLYIKNGLISRAKKSDTDVIFSKDILKLQQLKEHEIVDNITVTSGRIRGFFVKKGEVQPKTYTDITLPLYSEKLCIRPLKHDYNLYLLSSLYEREGDEYIDTFIKGIKENLALTPSSNDRGQVKMIYEGVCSISIGNSYYMELMKNDRVQSKWIDDVSFVVPENPVWLYSGVSLKTKSKETSTFMKYITSHRFKRLTRLNDYEYTDLNITEDFSKILGNKRTIYMKVK